MSRQAQARTSPEAPPRPRPTSYGETPTTPGRSRNMQAIRRTNTKPEVELRSALHRRGYRFRKDLSIYTAIRRVRPDVVFTARRVAVFVDGCFWHCCPEHGRQPSVNSGYWSPKLQRNVERDRLADAALQQDGWTVVRIWEHEELEAALATVIRVLDASPHR
ncbi:very short patch repair endonuclease [Kribbella albertanoniae]|uniref:Very short patch repair endonuclease n=1 Tax=Kribbella albertanoniae TaxID=1266829 RepID=A0A4R4QCM0_9ACTN|nr:very short patch repair endonuclease [Kribbella albertanoniae]TDC33154.1 very short patch repair endonuclease [Kribbella albertanoniae]